VVNFIVMELFFVMNDVIYVLCGLGLIFFGREIVMIVFRSKNKSGDTKTIPVKIIGFTVIYFVISYIALFIISEQLLGEISTIMLSHFIEGLMELSILLILFCPIPWCKQPKKENWVLAPL